MTIIEQTDDQPGHGERVFYIRDASGRPIACVAYQPSYDADEVLFAASYLHPNDAFDRALARRIALGRLRTHPDCAGLDGETPLSRSLQSLAEGLVAPSRVRRILLDGIRRRARQKATEAGFDRQDEDE